MNDFFKEKIGQVKNDREQLQAYLSNENNVVLAGPGSGKTTVLTLKAMKLLGEEILPPRGLACITFSNEACKEFTERLYNLGFKPRQNVFLGTVHSFCIAEVIQPFAHLYNYDIPLPFKLISDRKKAYIFRKIVERLAIQNLRIEDMDKERSLNIGGISKVKFPSYEVALRVAKEYEEQIHAEGFVDFTDIVKYATLFIQEQEYVRKCLSAKFPWILVDEYQDLGRPLHEMILALFNKSDIKVFLVGDPDQSIYGFAGAIPDFLLELTEDSRFDIIRLSTNYRSTQDIIDASEVVLNSETERNYIAGSRKTEQADFHFITCEEGMLEQYSMVTDNIIPECMGKGVSFEEICVLVGSNAELKELAGFFESMELPYYIPRHRYKRTEVIKWLEKCSMWVYDNFRQSFDELSNYWIYLNEESIGKAIGDRKIILYRKSLYDTLIKSCEYKSDLKRWISFVLEELQLVRILSESNQHEDDVDNIHELVQTLEEEIYSTGYDILKFANIGKPINQITLTTRHSSKGLEFEAVIMLGMEEGRFPSYWAITDTDSSRLEEEHRLCFVCFSRAKKTVYLVRSKYHIIKSRNWRKAHSPSRFWEALYSYKSQKTISSR